MDPNTAALQWRPIEPYGDLFTADVFGPNSFFKEYDGSGYWATDKHYAPQVSVFKYPKPEWATHVMWFNK